MTQLVLTAAPALALVTLMTRAVWARAFVLGGLFALAAVLIASDLIKART